jgi:predicted ATP-grasp superfamily ATP-dependent carboligase
VNTRRALIVEDGLSSFILSAARSLHRSGWTVGLGVESARSRALRSRAVHAVHTVPRPEQDLDAFVAGVNAAVRAGGYGLVFPGDDVELLALSQRRDELETSLPYASHDVVLRAVDKLSLMNEAKQAGVAVPETRPADDDAVRDARLPVAVKARLHWTPGVVTDNPRVNVTVCHERDGLRRAVDRLRAGGSEPLLQEVVGGPLMAVSALVDRSGRLVAVAQQRTIASTLRGTSARAVTVAVDEGLVAHVHSLLQRLGWFGIANLQFLEGDDGKPRLIDINGRCYGSVGLAVAAGVDLPALWAGLAVGDPSPPERLTAIPGVRFHYLEADLQRWRQHRSAGELLRVARWALGATHPTLSIRDPRPAFALAASYLRRGISR